MASTAEQVRIHYNRPPDRHELFVQQLVTRSDDCVVTFLEHTTLTRPVKVRDRIVLEPGSPAIWFTFPGQWHDIGRFHRSDGVFTGMYANVLTPVQMVDERTWHTTDLFLDLWMAAGEDAEAEILDTDELDEAVQRGWLNEELAGRARLEAEALRAACANGVWPPAIVREWPLARVLAELNRSR